MVAPFSLLRLLSAVSVSPRFAAGGERVTRPGSSLHGRRVPRKAGVIFENQHSVQNQVVGIVCESRKNTSHYPFVSITQFGFKIRWIVEWV